MDDEAEDVRIDELGSIEAIFPEIRKVDENDPFTFSLDLPVNPAKAVIVTFPAASTEPASDLVNRPGGGIRGGPASQSNANVSLPALGAGGVDSHEISYLPSVSLRISLPRGYPAQKPPTAKVSADPPWLPTDVVARLESDAPRLWEDMGRDLVAYTYIDHIQQAAEKVFDMVNANGALEVDSAHKLAILDYDIKSRTAAFEKETFECGVCLGTRSTHGSAHWL
jgi:E3 ubiquitin-protein ligase RNF14